MGMVKCIYYFVYLESKENFMMIKRVENSKEYKNFQNI